MARELQMKGISQEDIKKYFQENTLDEEKLAQRALTKVFGRWKNLNPLRRKKRAYDYLARKGFPYDIIRTIYEQEASI